MARAQKRCRDELFTYKGNNDGYMIVDNLRVRHAKKVKAWEEEHKDGTDNSSFPRA